MELLFLLPVLILSIVVHEVAHAWQARREGDDTAERAGRITLNPLPHIDPIGSVVVPLVLWAAPGVDFLFGWAKPVPVNPANFRTGKWGDIRVSLAGIVSNLILAALFTLLGAAVVATGASLGGGWIGQVVFYGIFINLILAFFNLIPIPPLDGSHVLYHMLPRPLALRYRSLDRFGLLILMAVIFLVPDAFGLLLAPVDYFMGAAYAFIRLWI